MKPAASACTVCSTAASNGSIFLTVSMNAKRNDFARAGSAAAASKRAQTVPRLVIAKLDYHWRRQLFANAIMAASRHSDYVITPIVFERFVQYVNNAREQSSKSTSIAPSFIFTLEVSNADRSNAAESKAPT
jgi:hypothetical protein